ncbi:MAG: class I tRNA ligase family protein, partial [Candidatus Niyogibacteria bacterium]|nr:class I tRNA ligase family protein [Candidatus Niyogibacteria bacterium]
AEVTAGLEGYELDRATRPFVDFIDDLSTWYLRRSRDRFNEAAPTLRFVLLELAKLLAPFTPFTAERVWQIMGGDGRSVHLESWPETAEITAEETELFTVMAEVRRLASLGLELRAKHSIKVRQPLAALRIKNKELRIKEGAELLAVLKDELNVKEIIFGAAIENDIELDLNITPELKEEGMLRDLIREAQDLRKKAGLVPQDKAKFYVAGGETALAFVQKYQKEFSEAVNAGAIDFVAAPETAVTKELSLDSAKILLGI